MPRQCTASDYLTHGAWNHTAASYPLQRRHFESHCSIGGRSKYADCADDHVVMRWRPRDACEYEPRLSDSLLNRTLFVIGDSIAFEIFVEVRAAIHTAAIHCVANIRGAVEFALSRSHCVSNIRIASAPCDLRSRSVRTIRPSHA